MSDDVTNLAEALTSAHVGRGRIFTSIGLARAVLASDWLAERDQAHRIIGAATAHTDAIAAYAELVERVEALAAKWEPSTKPGVIGWIGNPYSDQLRALIDPEATS